MKLIPSYQEFVYDLPLNGKISPKLAESLAADFEEIDSLNEGFLDSIKNVLSKTFLGSLSYINMIDKARAIILKDQKDLLKKKYSHEDEMGELEMKLKQASRDAATSSLIRKTITNKENEYKTYVKMLNTRIEKTEDTISKMIDGNKRRSEYYDVGKSQDDVTITEFEYKLAKARAKKNPEEIRELEERIREAKKEAEEAEKEMKEKAEKEKAEKAEKEKAEKEKAEKEKAEKEGKNSETPGDESGEESFSKQIENMEKSLKKVKGEIKALKQKQIDLEEKGKKLSKEDQIDLETKNTQESKLEKSLSDIKSASSGSMSKEEMEKLEKKSKETMAEINTLGGYKSI